MNVQPKQIHLLCLTKDGTDVENILSTTLKKRRLTDEEAAVYFPDSQPNDYLSTEFFVTVSFIRSILIPEPRRKQWDLVERCTEGSQEDAHGKLATVDVSGDNNTELLNKWGKKQLLSSWDNAIQLFDSQQGNQ